MTDDGTSNTRNVTSEERHTSLLQRVVTLLRLPQRGIYVIDSSLKRSKFHHRIRYLPPPKRIQALVQSAIPLRLHNLAPSLPHSIRKRRQRRLHPHLDGLKRTQCHICQKLRAGRCAQVDDCFVGVWEQFLAVEVLEDFVEAVFAGALEGVADIGGGPAEKDAAEAFLGVDGAPGLEVGGVELCVDLAATFYLEVQRSIDCSL